MPSKKTRQKKKQKQNEEAQRQKQAKGQNLVEQPQPVVEEELDEVFSAKNLLNFIVSVAPLLPSDIVLVAIVNYLYGLDELSLSTHFDAIRQVQEMQKEQQEILRLEYAKFFVKVQEECPEDPLDMMDFANPVVAADRYIYEPGGVFSRLVAEFDPNKQYNKLVLMPREDKKKEGDEKEIKLPDVANNQQTIFLKAGPVKSGLHEVTAIFNEKVQPKEVTLKLDEKIYKTLPFPYDLVLMSEKKLEKRTIEIECRKEGLKYRVVGLDDQMKESIILWDKLPSNFPRENAAVLNEKYNLLPKILEITSKEEHTPSKNERVCVDQKDNKEMVDEIAAECGLIPRSPLNRVPLSADYFYSSDIFITIFKALHNLSLAVVREGFFRLYLKEIERQYEAHLKLYMGEQEKSVSVVPEEKSFKLVEDFSAIKAIEEERQKQSQYPESVSRIKNEYVENPVVAADGYTYSASDMRELVLKSDLIPLSPRTREPFKKAYYYPSHSLKTILDARSDFLAVSEKQRDARIILEERIKAMQDQYEEHLKKYEQKLNDEIKAKEQKNKEKIDKANKDIISGVRSIAALQSQMEREYQQKIRDFHFQVTLSTVEQLETYLTKNKVDVNARDKDSIAALHVVAFLCGKASTGIKKLHFLLGKKADVRMVTPTGYTPLHIAILSILPISDVHNKMDLCIKLGSKLLDCKIDKSLEMLMSSINFQRHIADVKAAIEAFHKVGADIDAITYEGNTALHLIAITGCTEIATFLLGIGASKDIKNMLEQTPADIAKLHQHVEMQKILAPIDNESKHSASSINGPKKNNSVFPPSHLLVLNKDISNLEKFLKKNGEVGANEREKDNTSALHVAAIRSFAPEALHMIKLLIRYNSDVNLQTIAGYTPLLVAILNVLPIVPNSRAYLVTDPSRNLELKPEELDYKWLKELLKNGKKIGAMGNLKETIKTFLRAGANPNLATHDGYTVLHLVAMTESTDIAQMFLDKGADPTRQTQLGLTPADIALNYQNREMLKLLEEASKEFKNKKKPASTPSVASLHPSSPLRTDKKGDEKKKSSASRLHSSSPLRASEKPKQPQGSNQDPSSATPSEERKHKKR